MMENKIEKIILVVLFVIFVSVFLGAFWDLFGRESLKSYLCAGSSVGSINNLQATSTKEELGLEVKDVQVTPKQNISNPKTNSTKMTTNATPKRENNVAYSAYSSCLENAKDLATSKDCCDCLSGDASVHKACRDAAATYDFSKNTVFKTFEIPSTLGQNGDYSAFTASGNQQECKQKCESASSGLACGDFRFCRTACNSLAQ